MRWHWTAPMNSTPNGKATESDDISIVPADEKHAHAYDQIAGERLAHIAEQLTRELEQDAARERLARRAEQLTRELEQDAARRLAVLGRLPLRGGSALRGLIGLLLAACIFAAAFASQSPYGGAAKQIIARWAPRLVSTSSLPANKPELAAQPSPSSPQMVAAEPVPPTPSAQTAPQELGPTQSTPIIQSAVIQSTADAEAWPPTAKDAATREIGAASEPASQTQTENSAPSSEALFRQFEAWTAEQAAPGALVKPVQDAPALVVENAPAPARPMQKQRRVRSESNARHVQAPGANVRHQNARVQARPVQDARTQDQSLLRLRFSD
jgi:hypothetical protein